MLCMDRQIVQLIIIFKLKMLNYCYVYVKIMNVSQYIKLF